MTLSINASVNSNGHLAITVRGEIEFENADDIRSAVRAALLRWAPPMIVIDLGLVTFMDSSAIAALVGAQGTAAATGTRLVVRNPSPFLHHQLRVAGVLELLGSPEPRFDPSVGSGGSGLPVR